MSPIIPDLEAAAKQALHEIDCEKHTIGGVYSTRDDWSEVREAWIAVVLALVTYARLDCNLSLFEQRLEALKPFINDSPDVEHRIQQERCLWAVYSLDFDRLNDLLDGWTVENCDPVWMLRKAALLTEALRHDESVPLVQGALNLLRQDPAEGRSIASASREGWALASTLTMNNRQNIFREWSKLASLKCDAAAETDYVRRAMTRTDEQDEAPSFDVGVRQGTRVRFSNLSRSRLIAAYRAIRLLEVTGVPPVNNPEPDSGLPMSMVSDLLTLAANELGPVHTIGLNMISLEDGTYRSSIRTNSSLSAGATRQREHVEPPSPQRNSVRRRAWLQVAGLASEVWLLAHSLYPHEPLVQKRSPQSGVRTPSTRADSAHQYRGGFGGQHDCQGASRWHGRVKKNGPQSIGKSRGGWTTKIHMVAADARTALMFSLSAGQAHDAPEGRKLLNRLGPQRENLSIVMDRAYEGNETRQLALALGFAPVVPPSSTRVSPWTYDMEMYKRRNEVERLFRRLKGFRRIFSRFEKLDVLFLGFILLTLIVDALR